MRYPGDLHSTIPRLLDRARADQQRYEYNYYLVKPYDLDQQIETIRQLIGTA